MTALSAGVLAALLALYALHRYHLRHRRKTIERWEQRLEKLRREHTDRVRRLERERDRARETGHLAFVASLLPALDNLERARDALDDPPEGTESLVEGVDLAYEELERTLQSYEVERVEPEASEPFEPDIHEAMRAVDEADAEPGTVVECHRPGFRFEERVLRPAAVSVSVGEASNEGDDETAPEERDEASSVDGDGGEPRTERVEGDDVSPSAETAPSEHQ